MTLKRRKIATKRSQVKREYESRRPMGHVTLEKVFDQIKEGQIKEVRLIIKGDVDGSVEVLSDTLGKISTSEVKTNIIRRGVGAITESDVLAGRGLERDHYRFPGAAGHRVLARSPGARKSMSDHTTSFTKRKMMSARRSKGCCRRPSPSSLSDRPKCANTSACRKSA